MSTLCRKIKLYPVGDKEEVNRVYDFIRNSQYAQYQGLNLLMGQLTGKFYECGRDLDNEDFKKFRKDFMTNTNPIFDNIEFGKGVDSKSAITQKVKQDFSTALKNGLARGERSITNYKRTTPLIVRSRSIKFYHNYSDHNEFLDKLHDKDLEIFIKFVNNITFNVVLGQEKRDRTLREEMKYIFEEYFKVKGSSIQIDGKEIILNLSLNVPEKEYELDENISIGVDIGVAIPAVCSLNNGYGCAFLGSAKELIRVRTQLQSQRRSLQANLKYSKGGHGRKKKLKALEKYKNKERHFVQTYNHMISKRVVDFAIKNKAKYINLEDLSGFKDSHKDSFILRNWSYYELQQFIEYKAKMAGITVRKVNPCYSSQVCSCCGTWHEFNRESQSSFICKNKKCKNFGKRVNADLNASKNIAKISDKDMIISKSAKIPIEKLVKNAEKHYNIQKQKKNAIKELCAS